MPEYRRSFIPGGTYFFTVVTYHRLPILVTKEARNILRLALKDVKRRFPFSIDAVCLLPDHVHCIWTLPEGDANYSVRWGEIKRIFSTKYQKMMSLNEPRSLSREKRGEAAVWQRRFWEHTLRDEEDFRRHLDYIHYNPVKHGLVERVSEWEWSSFHRYVRIGWYDAGWGGDLECGIQIPGGE